MYTICSGSKSIVHLSIYSRWWWEIYY